jgi:hypothetical protein
MPPIMGAGAFVMATYTQIPYLTIVGVALLPALLYFFSAQNDRTLRDLAPGAGVVVAAWGAGGTYLGRDQSVRLMVPGLHYLRLTKDGHPGHPLYLPASLRPVAWVSW